METGKSKSFNDITAYGAMDASHLPIYKAMQQNKYRTGNYNEAGRGRDGYNLFDGSDGAKMEDYTAIFMREAGKMYGFTRALGEIMGYNGEMEYGSKHCATCSCKEEGMQSKEGHGIQHIASPKKSGLESRLGKHYKN